MVDLGIPNNNMGARDHTRRSEIHIFFPGDREGRTVSHAGQITLDSRPMNPELLANGYDEAAQMAWQRTRIGDRALAIIAHELAEHEYGGDHELALIAGPETRAADQPRGAGAAQADGTRLEESVAHSNAASVSRKAPSRPRVNE